MSGWDDFQELPQQPNQKKNHSNQNKNNNNNNRNSNNNNNRNNYNNQSYQQNQGSNQGYKQQQKPVYVEKQEDQPRRFQFFNSNKNKPDQEKDNVSQDQVEEKKVNLENTQVQSISQKQVSQLPTLPSVQQQKQQEQQQEQPQQQQQQQQATKVYEVVNANYNAPHKILIRSKEGIYDTSCYSQSMNTEKKVLTGPADFMCLSKDEQYILVTLDTVVKVIKVSDNSVVSQREFVSIKHTNLSQNNMYIQVLDRIDNNKYTSFVFSFPDFKLLKEFNEKRYIKENAPYVKFNKQETKAFYYNYSTGFIEVYETPDFSKIIQQAEMQNLDFFQVSPEHDFIVGCFLEHMVGYEKTQAKLQFYNLEKDKREKVKNIEKAQEINIKWSPDGNNLILATQTIHDATGNTYYGQTALWRYQFGKKYLHQIPTIDGPVHDVDWHPNGEQFIAIVGYMPAKPILYNLRCEPLFSFGTMHRNTIRFQPQGRFVLFGGFGNISGDVDVWELNSLEKLAKFNSNTSASIEWSLDGKHILTGVLTPRLRVDNNFKLFKWNGELINTCNFSHTELYEVVWKKNQQFTDMTPIPENEITIELNKQRQITKSQACKKPLFGGGSFAESLRNERGEEGPKKLTGEEEWVIKAKNEAKKNNK
ncbi:hypothetical protein ABPG72_018460 [Tetrahymena utriculariae]